MKIVQTISKTVEFSYYGRPIKNRTITTYVSDLLTPEEIEIAKESAVRELEHHPIKTIPIV